MLTRRTLLAAGGAFPAALMLAQRPLRKPRRDCFFGIHLDLHPSANDQHLGRDLTAEMIERFLTAVKPDYVQYDCKGHAGWLGYRSQVSKSSPGIVNDSLQLWRAGTARHGVGLFVHFSGVWDSLAVAEHPEWARVRPDGKKEESQTSTYGPYVDKRMIPQLLEVAEKYDLDGAWVDGECWATNPDYCARAAAEFRKVTGISELPKKAGDQGWNEFLQLNREQFRLYVKHYIDEVHKAKPNFQIASNWLYSTYVPERPTLPVDFLSGDYLGNAPISRARLEARYLAATGKPWDLMAWGFQSANNNPLGHIHKPAASLMQESSIVLAQGGGFQVYYQPTRAGWIDDRHVETMSQVGAFCRARQAVSHKTETVPQVGVLFSSRTLYRTANKLFGGWGAHDRPAVGAIEALLACHYSVDVIPDWKLREEAARYPLLVVPEWLEIGDEVAALVRERAAAGGHVLVMGAVNTRLFAKELGVRCVGEAKEQAAWIPQTGVFANAKGIWQDVEAEGAEVVARRYATYDATSASAAAEAKVAATVARMGNGMMACMPGPVGSAYAVSHAPALAGFLQTVVGRLFEPLVKVEAAKSVELSLRTKGTDLLIHLIDTIGMQVSGDHAAPDAVPRTGPMEIAVGGLTKAPRRVRLEPGGAVLQGRWSGGVWKGTVPGMHIHSVVVVEKA
ncbi:MAG: hypothetical protein IPJ98_22945 [Bryobacterales bacterium]|nr:hypothetical protein [Bryobacterales bacterium]